QLTLTFNVVQPPIFTSPTTTVFGVGQSNSFSVTTTGFPGATLSLMTTPLPPPSFVSFNSGTGVLSGSPVGGDEGTYQLTFSASNVAFTANVSDTSNVLTGVSTMAGIVVGQTISGNGIPDGTTVTAFDEVADTITLSATPTTAGSSVSLTSSVLQNFTLKVGD